MRRISRYIVPLALLALVVTTAPHAQADRRDRDDAPGASFQLRSALLTRVPEVAKALDDIRANPGDPAEWRTLGTILSRRAAHEDAMKAFEVALALDENDPDTYVDLGAAQIRAQQADDAIDTLEEALEIEPFHALAHYNLGLAYQQEKHYDDAIESFERALLLEPWLGDPNVNPGAVNNPDLDMVKLRVYLKTTGATPSIFTINEYDEETETDERR